MLRSAVFIVPMMRTFSGTENASPLRQLRGGPAFVGFNQGDEFAENLRDVAAIDLVDQDDVSMSRIAPRGM